LFVLLECADTKGLSPFEPETYEALLRPTLSKRGEDGWIWDLCIAAMEDTGRIRALVCGDALRSVYTTGSEPEPLYEKHRGEDR